jgi:hypothetical protein
LAHQESFPLDLSFDVCRHIVNEVSEDRFDGQHGEHEDEYKYQTE